ncbi:MAG: UTRA domain-containing protein, partial [Ignavibacteria bacterium]|nr:UTRA domain-containing protein [Ignavibacteria bacterium]
LEESLSLKYFPGMDKLDLREFSFYPYIFKTYPDIYTIKRELTIDSLPKEIALVLKHNEGIPAIHTISKSYNSNKHLVEYTDTWSVADYFKFKVDVEL